ncbi:MAG TPA: hypothetical protein VJZ71_12810 [Phycisphaerae bacterium]|nr:hypothetical protein [Phycisphaerae bacterium]
MLSRNTSHSAETLFFVIIISLLTAFTRSVFGQTCPSSPTLFDNDVLEGPLTGTSEKGLSPSIAVDDQSRFLAAWETPTTAMPPTSDYNEIIVLGFSFASGFSCQRGPQPVSDYVSTGHNFHNLPSVAMSSDARVRVGWTGGRWTSTITDPTVLLADFGYDDNPATWPMVLPPAPPGRGDFQASVGLSDATTDADVVGWSNRQALDGLFYDAGSETEIRSCSTYCSARTQQWQPCVAMRDDGHFVICWADAEEDENEPPFNILLQLYDAGGNSIGGEVLVNDPSIEQFLSQQRSPAVAFDSDGRIVVAWAGTEILGCSSQFKVYARRFEWDGTDPDAAPAAVGPEFIVNSSTSSPPAGGTVTRPAVAITNATGALAGRYIVAWNVGANGSNVHEVHAQYFEADGRPLGGEFVVNQEPGYGGDNVSRRLSNSAQKTVAYAPAGDVVIVWTRLQSGNNTVHFTRLPDDYAEYQDSLLTCLKGDVNRDGLVNGLDIQDFIDLLLGGPLCLSIVDICPADMNSDLAVDITGDLDLFIFALLGGTPQAPPPVIEDCNSNQVPDDQDIASQSSNDVNTNGVPDECEWDCNSNGVPDDWDIAQATSADCNTNGFPDECEADCNTNGVPDDCDVDPTDPDGDEFVSADCNSNAYPDECDLALPPGFGSLDCNTNGIPDECDLAACEGDPACDDCNANGIPDSCDIAAEISEDINTNGIPDECEGEGMMGGETMMSGEGGEFDEEAAWEAFYDWAATQCWGPTCETSGAEQFGALAAKLQELGLPISGRVIEP